MLPPEIIQIILFHLDHIHDILKARLVCKLWNSLIPNLGFDFNSMLYIQKTLASSYLSTLSKQIKITKSLDVNVSKKYFLYTLDYLHFKIYTNNTQLAIKWIVQPIESNIAILMNQIILENNLSVLHIILIIYNYYRKSNECKSIHICINEEIISIEELIINLKLSSFREIKHSCLFPIELRKNLKLINSYINLLF